MVSKKNLLSILPLFLIIVLASFLRLLWLDRIPVAIGGDELTYIFNAKAIFLTGSDISGTWNPLTAFIFHYPAYTTPQAELSYFLFAPIVGFFNFSLFNARITAALFSILSVFLIYLLGKELMGKRVGLLAGLIAAVNPWLIYVGRTSYEMIFAMFFYCLGLYILLKVKGWKILWSVPIFYLAFYSYIATKLIFIPFVLISITYCYFVVNKRKYLKQYLVVFLLSILIVGVYAFMLKQSPDLSRLGEIFTPNSPILVDQVDAIRKITMQSPLKNIFENKITEYLMIIFTKMANTTSFSYLFLSGDNFFSLFRHGLFYILDAAFLIFGLAAAYKRSAKVFFLLVSFVFIAILPHVFHGTNLENFTPHITLLFPFLIILIAVGIDEILLLCKNKRLFYAILSIIIGLYVVSVLYFLNIYFFQFPLQGFFDFHVRLFSKYTVLTGQTKQQVLVYSPNSSDIFKKYLFYSNNYNQKTAMQIKTLYKMDKFDFANIKFMGCDNTIDPTTISQTIIYDFNCGALKKEYKRIVIPRLSDGGQSYDIFNDKVCQSFNLQRFPANLKISDFAIENQTAQKFCETFITNP
jgi:4-amino-4-deoxy-L-arabinose transferase-like glycosyltransferase